MKEQLNKAMQRNQFINMMYLELFETTKLDYLGNRRYILFGQELKVQLALDKTNTGEFTERLFPLENRSFY